MELTNRTILITGASSGIGEALARRLAHFKCSLILVSRRKEILDKLKEELKQKANSIITLQCDVSSKTEVTKIFDFIHDKKIKIDIAILNAGIGNEMKVENYDSAIAEKIFNTNVLGMIYFIEKLIPEFIQRRSGIIAGISSLADNRGYSRSGFYCASKAAISVYLESLRLEFKPYGVKVITIKPGFVKTPMTSKNKFPMPFIISAENAADIIIKGIQKEKRVIQFPMPTVILSRLVGLLPTNIYEYLASKII
ncbi:SDR family NAD(P)-dependent oxidoreductase [Melioribacteraceae bacterium 4301-Me]|uniref:SDR family NAD(P)-dependent oxidoreductase n=1 Tax=Pyranulibacter aquaticus TaxID=3163344 RepID=UPI003594B457